MPCQSSGNHGPLLYNHWFSPQERTHLALDENIYELRREKLKKIEALGHPVYPHKYETTHSVPHILAEYTQSTGEQLEQSRTSVRIAGRIMSMRLMGKAAFIHLQQGGQRLQCYVKKDAVGEKGFELFNLLDLGDHIGVAGYLFRTRTNELSVHVDEITFLSKDLLPLPEKWHGLTDVELRYRQRYVDMTMNPDVREVFVKRAKIVQSMRRFFDSRGYVEVETPMMQPIAGGAVARPFVTHHNALDMQLFLRVAPELYLKRLVVGGLERVYEINRNFRNEGISTQHNPEFTMLEFYQAYSDYQELMVMTEQMLSTCAHESIGSDQITFGDHKISLAPPYRRVSLREGARVKASERLGTSVTDDDLRRPETAAALARRLDLAVLPSWGAGKIATEIFERLNEADLIPPTFVYDFPTEVS